MAISPKEFGASFKGFLDQMSAAAPSEEPIFRRRLREHFEQEPNQLPTLTEKFALYDHANLHTALEAELSGSDCSVVTMGVISPHPRHMKRGMLLHGKPGTGKTLTAMYIAQAVRDRTVLLLTGRGQGMIEQSCAMARALQPSIIILEDVDLVAEERTRPDAGCTAPLLFELLNQMDGLADDADVLFLLTTNRPDILEPALAARPGRVDQAIEVPLPDAACRRRLFELYADKLSLGAIDWDRFIKRTEGASGAFIRELMRKAALFAADESSRRVEDRHFDEALHELVVEGGTLTQSLLGFTSGNDAQELASS